ncbi:M24 family metallopeptidase [Draconibacterium sp. IB214405]|uniref:M24 family metallopeptidase n=1 Tax=Draconibacterium sp. IB214405 TaxID=3097352 RepID=UPI002A174509|nr:M24 family metallopeptidase [Draconibacterium sp. IB214405]MDX8337867.1 M24 family metallopeptidase [Draconibacterium sp. IB214405]
MTNQKSTLTLVLFILFCFPALAQNPYFPKTLDMQQRAEVVDVWLEERVETVLPEVMRRAGVDMWLVMAREYNEDPVIKTLLPATWQSARRTTMLIAYDPGDGKPLETFGVSRYDTGNTFKTIWNKEEQPDQWKALAEIIAAKDPAKIGINKSETFALADGLSSTLYDKLMEVLPDNYRSRVVSAENVAIGWLETRTPSEMIVYANIVRMAHQIIAEGFSEKVIQPGVTTTNDVVWWYRNRIRELGFTTWFHPSVEIQRADTKKFDHLQAFSENPDEQVIQPGDLLHVDFGITYLRLNTDTQQHAYVLQPGETTAPPYLKAAFKTANRVQDIFTSSFKAGLSGNDILKAALAQCKAEGLKASIYTHPLGFHGHAAGPTIGLWDQQDGVPGAGDYPLYANTAYAIELNAAVNISEWNKEIRIMLEEDAFFDGDTVRYIDGRQTELLTIPRSLAGVE